MGKNKSKRDIISEHQYNIQMEPTPTSPEKDSPGDSEEDAGSEFLMGLNFMPDEKNEYENSGRDSGKIIFPKHQHKEGKVNTIPDTAKVVSSEKPGPWADLDSESDTH